jgi:hypothetical protein
MFVKVFPSMYDGTLATRGPWQALVTFQQLLVLADPKGIVDMTPEAISRRTTIPLEIITAGIAALEQSDPESRSPGEDGRRIVRLSDHRSWGWRIVNYLNYRGIRDEEARREYMANYQRERRANEKALASNVNTCKPQLAQAEGDAEADAESRRRKKNGGERKTPLPEDFQISDAVREWAKENAKGHYHNLQEHLACFVSKAKAHGYEYVDWDEAFKTAIRENWAKLPEKSQQRDWV